MKALLGQALWQGLKHWLMGDRIRIAPTTGRLLSLKKGDRCLILGELFDVLARQVIADGLQVEYRLNDHSHRAVLTVGFDRANGRSEGTLEVSGIERVVYDDDVVVLKPDNRDQRWNGDC